MTRWVLAFLSHCLPNSQIRNLNPLELGIISFYQYFRMLWFTSLTLLLLPALCVCYVPPNRVLGVQTPILSLEATWRIVACLLLAPLLAYIATTLWRSPEVPILWRLLWARAKEVAGVRVSSRQLTKELVAVTRRYAPALKQRSEEERKVGAQSKW